MFVSLPAAAQDAPPPVTAEQAIGAAEQAYGPQDSRAERACPPQRPGDEIVVCAPLEEQSQFRVEPTQTDGTEGDPRAPNIESSFGHTGMGVVFKGCFIPPCPPPMPTLIDLKAIPEAPPGSDADRVARGLAPTGRDERLAPAALPPATETPATPPG